MIVPLEKPGTPEELVHFGVKGMKWGVRKEEESSGRNIGPVRTKLIKYHTNQARKQQSGIDYIDANPGKNFYTKRVNAKTKIQREKVRDQHLKDVKNLEEGHLTDFQKKALIGGAITVAALGAYGAYRLHDSRGRELIQTGDKVLGISYKRNPLLSRTMTSKQIMEEVVPQINPGGTKIPGRSKNCLRCSFAYELRRRGFDVEATNRLKGGPDQTIHGMIDAISGGKAHRISDFESLLGRNKINVYENVTRDMSIDERARSVSSTIFSALSKQERGARGELGMSWTFGGAHSVSWENIGGRPHIFDTQSGKHFQSPDEFLAYTRHMMDAGFTRLDDIDLDEGFLTGWIQNVK